MQLAELSVTSGVTPRNIRRYISLGIVLPPIGRTKNARYTSGHLEDLAEVREMLAREMSLASIKEEMDAKRQRTGQPLAGTRQRSEAASPLAIEVVEGVVVVVMGEHESIRKHRDAVVAGFRKVLAKAERL